MIFSALLTETIHNYTIVQPVISNRVDSQVSLTYMHVQLHEFASDTISFNCIGYILICMQDGSHLLKFTLTVNEVSVHLTMNK